MTRPPPLRLTEGPLAALRARPLAEAVAQAARRKGDYRAHPIDDTAPEHGEPMVELRDAGLAGANHYAAPHNPPYHTAVAGSTESLRARDGIAARLGRVNGRLAPYGLDLWVFDAWRPIAVQNHFHDHWMPDYLSRARPELTGDALWAEVTRYWARGAPGGVIDPASPPPHATGAAVDLTIRDRATGAHLFMGSIFDDVTDLSNTDAFEGTTDAMSFSALEARDNRRMLFWVMAAEGFANNPTEWWHFSWGDQMWARITGAAAAVYGPAPLP
jgi:D-alanyl-D-alanine dipeptidase